MNKKLLDKWAYAPEGAEYLHKYTYDFERVLENIAYRFHEGDWMASSFSPDELVSSGYHLTRPTKEEEKPVYTQAMHNMPTAPATGADFFVGDTGGNGSRISDFENKVVTVLATTTYKGGTIITFYNSLVGIGCGMFSTKWVKPIYTRTDREKLKTDIMEFEQNYHDCTDYYDQIVNAIISGDFHKTTYSGDK